MRRFSQRNSLVTLNDINITPLLDLAFVLLIIFVITTPLLEQSIKMDLPVGGQPQTQVRKDQVRTIEVDPTGGYVVDRQKLNIQQLEQLLVNEFRMNPELALYIRADEKEAYGNVMAILNICDAHGIKKMNFGMAPYRKR